MLRISDPAEGCDDSQRDESQRKHRLGASPLAIPAIPDRHAEGYKPDRRQVLQKRRGLMEYPSYQQQGWPIGSGSVGEWGE